jgi:hypothetical protein
VRADLREQQPRLLLDALDGILAGDPTQRRLVAVGDLDERLGELGRVPACRPFIVCQAGIVCAVRSA